jgi:glycosyltransferase involved in cell wall biosynthesis
MTPAEQDPGGISKLAAIVPTYNVGNLVAGVVEGLRAVGCHIVVVDDGSTDGGLESLDKDEIALIRHGKNLGKGHAILAGLRDALSDKSLEAFAILDADGQHDPAELPPLFEAFVREQADLLIGSRRFDEGYVPFRSRFGNVMTAHALRWLLGVQLPDTQSGYRILSRRFAEAVVQEIRGGRYETEMAIVGLAIRGDYRLVSEPIRTIYEAGNRTSHFRKLSDSWRVYRTLLGTAFSAKRQ